MTFYTLLDRRALASTSVLASIVLASGCMSSPTYGTDKTAGVQLLEDVSNIAKPIPERKAPINYAPRPELVRSEGSRNAPLPAPQESVASVDNPDWVESPEERRVRVREEVDARNRGGGQSRTVENGPVASDEVEQIQVAAAANQGRVGESPRFREGTEQAPNTSRREEIKRRLQEQNQGSPNSRKYLSEPPLDYRQPAASAPVGDIGEDEWKKERRVAAEARKKAGKKSWRDYIPGL